MIEAKVTKENFDAFPKIIKGLNDGISILAKDLANKTRALVQGRTPHGQKKHKGYFPGHAERSWSEVKYVDNGSYSFENDAAYARALDKGSKKGKKPWPSAGEYTVESRGNIFSSRLVDSLGSGIIDPIINDSSFVTDVTKLITDYIEEKIKEYA